MKAKKATLPTSIFCSRKTLRRRKFLIFPSSFCATFVDYYFNNFKLTLKFYLLHSSKFFARRSETTLLAVSWSYRRIKVGKILQKLGAWLNKLKIKKKTIHIKSITLWLVRSEFFSSVPSNFSLPYVHKKLLLKF